MPRSDCPGQVNFALVQVKIEVWWPSRQVKLASVASLVGLSASVSLINDNFQSETIFKLKTARQTKQ